MEALKKSRNVSGNILPVALNVADNMLKNRGIFSDVLDNKKTKKKKRKERKETQACCLHFSVTTGDVQCSRAFLARLHIRGTCLGSMATDEDLN